MNGETIDTLATIVTQFGTGAIFLVLYIKERAAHDKTRRRWNDDLRDAAGFEPHLRPNPPAPLPDEMP